MIEHIDCSKELIWITLDARAGPFWAWDKIRVLGSAWPCLCTFSSTPARQQGSLVSQTGGGFFLFTLCPFQPFSQIGGVFFLFTFPKLKDFFFFSHSTFSAVDTIIFPWSQLSASKLQILFFLGSLLIVEIFLLLLLWSLNTNTFYMFYAF